MKRLKKPLWLLLILLVVMFFGWATTGIFVYIRIFLLLLLVLVTSNIWSLTSLEGIQIARRTRSLRSSVGKILDEHFEVVNISRWTRLWVEIKDNSPIPQKSGSRLLTNIGGLRQRSYTTRTRITRRGAYALGPTLIKSGDPFGFFTNTKEYQSKETLIVYPFTVDIPYFPLPRGILPGGKEIYQKTLDVTPHATGVREYIPGDPMKRIHWQSTAKRNNFMVKVYEQDPQSEIWFFLDSQLGVQYSRPIRETEKREDDFINYRRTPIKLPEDTYEYSISVTASLAKYFLHQKKVVGLVSSGSTVTVIPAERGERQIGKILETLAFLKPDGELPISGCVNMQSKYLPLGSGVILVTPSITDNILFTIETLKWRKLHPMVILILAEFIGGPEREGKSIFELEKREIPVFNIQCGQNLDSQLGNLRVDNQRTWMPGKN